MPLLYIRIKVPLMKNLLLVAAIVLIVYGITCNNSSNDKPATTTSDSLLDTFTFKSSVIPNPSNNALEKTPGKINNKKGKSQKLNPVLSQTSLRAPVVKKHRRIPASGHQYIRGPRGGCYYINRNGNKTYVDRSLCN